MKSITMQFNKEKAINAILLIAYKLTRKDFHKIFKILYFADREHFVNYGRTITGDKYFAMNDGPVPSNIYDIFKSIRGDGYFKDDGYFSKYFAVSEWDILVPLMQPDLDCLSKSDKTFLEKCIELYGDMTWDAIKEKSHDYAWHSTTPNRQIRFEDIILEAGGDEEYIAYLAEQSILSNLTANGI